MKSRGYSILRLVRSGLLWLAACSMCGAWSALSIACSDSTPVASTHSTAQIAREPVPVAALPQTRQRGHEPWVLRSVVDEHPRMLSAALAPDFWVAYDTEHAALYKVWLGGLNLDGAVYNTHHGPQPTTQGETLLLSSGARPWHMLREGRELPVRVRYRGHELRAGQLYLNYRLEPETGTYIEVEERPEIVETIAGQPALERTFTLRGAPSETHVELDVEAAAFEPADLVQVHDRGGPAETITGRLALTQDRPTRIVLRFARSNTTTARVATQPEERTGAELIAAEDCASCHNPTLKTIGPSYTDIARRYRTNAQTIAGLAAKIREGGAFQWGEAAMVAHPFMQEETSLHIAEFILRHYDPQDAHGSLTTHPLSREELKRPAIGSASLPGVGVASYDLGHVPRGWPSVSPDTAPNTYHVAPTLRLTPEDAQLTASQLWHVTGQINIEQSGDYNFLLEHDGAAMFTLQKWQLIRQTETLNGSRRQSPWVSIELEAGVHPFEIWYKPGIDPDRELSLRWQPPDQPSAERVPTKALFTQASGARSPSLGTKPYRLAPEIPGDRSPLTGVHPSFDLRTVRPHNFKPRVGGLDFLPDGRAVLSTWDSRGAVYVLDGLSGDPEDIQVTQIAEGLSEPLGLKVVDGTIYVLQKHELTRLVDMDADGITDKYETVSNAWGATANFHEFAFGLAYRDGAFYATLATAVEPGGAAVKHQHPDRGSVVRIDATSGKTELIAKGLRTPNGIGEGPKGELFITDNEGDWLPANKLLHLQSGAFYGARQVDPVGTRHLKVTQPVVWLPMREIAFSPSQPILFNTGPYRDQLLYGDVTFGGIGRVVVHPVGDTYQGCVMQFTQGLEAGVNRLALAPDGAIYIGGIGNPADWAQEHKLWYGLQRLSYNATHTFELLDAQIHHDGIELQFTEALRAGDGERTGDYAIEQWYYVPTAAYGGPKVGERKLTIRAVHVSEDRRRVFLSVDGMRAGHVLHVRLAEPMVSNSSQELWTTETWCTLNTLPQEPGPTLMQHSAVEANTLSSTEREAGFELWFDGKKTDQLRDAKGQPLQARHITAATLAPGLDAQDLIASSGALDDYELEFDWRVTRPGWAALFPRVQEPAHLTPQAAPALVLSSGTHCAPLQCSGAVYDAFPPARKLDRPCGTYNRSRIVVRGTQVEHWLNGRLAADYDTSSDAVKAHTTQQPSVHGQLVFKDYGADLRLRDIKLRRLPSMERTTGHYSSAGH